MALYDSKSESSVFSAVDVSDRGDVAVFRVRHELDIAVAKDILAMQGQKVVAESNINGDSVLVTQLTKSKQEVLAGLATSGNNFEAHKEPNRAGLGFVEKQGWTIRSSTSLVAQCLQILSSLNPHFGWNSKGNIEEDTVKSGNNAALLGFAISNLTANLMNRMFGGEKIDDALGFKKVNDTTESEVNRFLPDGNKFELPADKQGNNQFKTAYMTPEELEKSKPNPTMDWLRKNSVGFGEIGLRMIGTFAMICSPDKWKDGIETLFKTGSATKAFNEAKVKDNTTFYSGLIIMTGKLIGLLASAKDKLAPPTSPAEKFAQDAAWTISSGVEFVGTMPMLAAAVTNKKMIIGGEYGTVESGKDKGKTVYLGGGTTVVDPTSVAAQILNASAYPVKAILPKAEKYFDLAETQARQVRGALKLHEAGQGDKICEVMARVTSDITEQMGAKSPGFANLFSDVLQKLEKHHGISPFAAPADNLSAEHEFAEVTSKKQFADERIKQKTRTPIEPKSESMQERATVSREAGARSMAMV